jgi:adenylosuccinate synthase
MSKEDIAERGLVEYGVNTGRMRRRSTHIDLKLLKYSVMLNGPTEIALTFCDQYDRRIEGVKDKALITKDIRRLLRSVEKAAGIPVRYLDTGKDFGSIVALW